jgi:hypothetical protein
MRDFVRRREDPGFRAIFPAHARDHRDKATHYLTHRSGLVFVALVKKGTVYAHAID